MKLVLVGLYCGPLSTNTNSPTVDPVSDFCVSGGPPLINIEMLHIFQMMDKHEYIDTVGPWAAQP